ncbi:MAG: 50S ribosomal protein L11 methyltransferase [Steroidobacteraceae bacterium]|jgi:ribosomal protein L11 methyltransferase|nr:50S ribosomal protein L11 methyltransferase [Gammaproteobacteria bacterium]
MAVIALRLALASEDARDPLRVEEIEQVFFDAGALSVVLTDQRDDPVLEPKPGEIRLWPATQLEALFAADSPSLTDAGLTELATAIGYAPSQFHTESIADRAWEREWLRNYEPLRFGERLWICPTHHVLDELGAIIVHLDPGLAFGTGTHATTRLCLEFLDSWRGPLDRMIDYGCGSGILALAALRLGVKEAWVHDIDPQALEATEENARRNDVESQIRPYTDADHLQADCQSVGPAPLVVANILAAPLIELAESLSQLLAPGGTLVLAGLLTPQAEEVIAAYQPWLPLTIWREQDGWACLVGQRS